MSELARNYDVSIVLKDGCLLQIRSIRPEDKTALAGTFRQLSKESVHARFLTYKKELTYNDLAYLTEVDFVHHVSLVAVLPESNPTEIVGIVRYILIEDKSISITAEIALVVVDKYQSRGIGAALLKHIANLARQAGIMMFEAYVLHENGHIRHLFKHCGYRLDCEVNGKELKLILKLDFPGEGHELK